MDASDNLSNSDNLPAFKGSFKPPKTATTNDTQAKTTAYSTNVPAAGATSKTTHLNIVGDGGSKSPGGLQTPSRFTSYSRASVQSG